MYIEYVFEPHYLKYNFPEQSCLSVGRLVWILVSQRLISWMDGRFVLIFYKDSKVTLPCCFRSTFYTIRYCKDLRNNRVELIINPSELCSLIIMHCILQSPWPYPASMYIRSLHSITTIDQLQCSLWSGSDAGFKVRWGAKSNACTQPGNFSEWWRDWLIKEAVHLKKVRIEEINNIGCFSRHGAQTSDMHDMQRHLCI